MRAANSSNFGARRFLMAYRWDGRGPVEGLWPFPPASFVDLKRCGTRTAGSLKIVTTLDSEYLRSIAFETEWQLGDGSCRVISQKTSSIILVKKVEFSILRNFQ